MEDNMEKTEKVSVNMNIGTLSQIDILVDNGFYSNRSDFINQAVREALKDKQHNIQQEMDKYDKMNFIWFMGICRLDADELMKIKNNGNKKVVKGHGLLYIDEYLDDLAIETISKINVKGKVICSDRLKEYYNLNNKENK